MVEDKFPARYRNYADVFNKITSDKLLDYKTKIDYDIVLKTENNLLFNLFYSIFLKQLELIKNYFENYFKKEFIVLITYSTRLQSCLLKSLERNNIFTLTIENLI